jgi:hypothetical protein
MIEDHRIIDRWAPAQADLGIDVTGPLIIQISDSLTVHADILVKSFGGSNGTIGVEDSRPLEPFLKEIWDAGYGVTEFGKPFRAVYDRAAIISCLSEWGWSGPADLKPSWLIE